MRKQYRERSVIHVVQIETGYVFETVVAFEHLVTSIEARSGGFGDASAPEKSRHTSHAPRSTQRPLPCAYSLSERFFRI